MLKGVAGVVHSHGILRASHAKGYTPQRGFSAVSKMDDWRQVGIEFAALGTI
jgi:hypothetical protein